MRLQILCASVLLCWLAPVDTVRCPTDDETNLQVFKGYSGWGFFDFGLFNVLGAYTA